MSKKNVKKAPELRFKGFSDDWEQRKLGDSIKFINGRAYKQQELLEQGKYRVLRVGNFNTNDRWYYSNLELEDNKYADTGDLLYLWATSFGPAIWKEERVIYHYHIWKLEIPDKKIDKRYLYTWLETDKERIKQTTNGTTMVHITKNSMEKREFRLPSDISEQRRLGDFFKQIDNTIALHQRKLEQLSVLKQAYLQTMFPEKEERLPKLRFANFRGDWKQRKLGEVAVIKGGGTPSTTNPDYWDGDIDWYAPMEIGKTIFVEGSKRKITELGLKNSSARMLPVGTVLFTSRAGIGNTAILNKEGSTNQGFQSIIPIDNKLDTYFIYSKTDDLKLYGEKMGAGSTFVEVSGKQMAQMPLRLPNVSEQIGIGNLFRIIDNTIDLHQQKLDNLLELKRAFLQKMFI